LAQSSPSVRNYQRNDLQNLIGLYSRSLANSTHFVRNQGFVKYFMQYQGVNEGSVFVAETNGEIIGLAIVSITVEIGGLKQGKIIEFLARDSLSMRALIRVVINFCKGKDVDLIVVVPPASLEVDDIFKDWIKFETNVMMTKILSLPSLLQALLSSEKIITTCAGTSVVFQIGRELVEAKIGPKKVDISQIKGEPRRAKMFMSSSPQTFLKIIFGQLNPYVAYLTGRIRIHNVKNTRPMLKLLCMMQLTAPFYTGLADRL